MEDTSSESLFLKSEEEEILEETTTRVWNTNNIWKFILLLFIIGGMGEFLGPLIPIFTIITIWIGFYMVRQRWRIILTDKQIIARQLYPRPFTFFTRVYNFPLKHIEGLSIGPRAFHSILLLGIFLTTNVGVNLLKSGLSERQRDLPDTLEAVILLLQGITFIPSIVEFGNDLESFSEDILKSIGTAQTTLGITFIIIGFIIVFLTIPRRYHLQIRVRHGKDFKLNAGINRDFWSRCYKEIYQTELVDAPPEANAWRYAWLKDEKIEGIADLQRTIYFNRLIGIFAVYIGLLRMYQALFSDSDSTNLLLWLIVALVDLFIVVISIRFSSFRNEMVITNKRIIFAEEVKGVSGAFGRKLFYLSDIKRDDVAGFDFLKIRKFSMRYLIFTLFLIGVFLTVYSIINILVIVLFIITIIGSMFFINQTYVEFTLNTKGGEFWKMRHQLSNPATYVRQFFGAESNLVNVVMSNRLEEREIIETVQLIRSGDLKLDTTYDQMTNRNTLQISDLLLKDESIVYETNVSRTVPRRKLTLSIATLIFIFWMFLILVPFAIAADYDEVTISEEMAGFAFFISICVGFMLLIVIWVKYYSLFKASLVLTNHRIFFQDIKKPPFFTYYLGINEETYTTEALLTQIHSTYTSRQFNQSEFWKLFLKHTFAFMLSIATWGICIGLWVVSIGAEEGADEYYIYEFVSKLQGPLLILLSLLIVSVAWNSSNGFVEIVRSWPKRIFNANGIGFQIHVPFASKTKTEEMRRRIWGEIVEANIR